MRRFSRAAGAPLVLSVLAVGWAGCTTKLSAPPASPVVVAVFDPVASPPAIPLPNDLALSADGTHLVVTSNPGDSAAQVDFDAYLSTLDGFPSDSSVTFSFGGAIDPTTLTAPSGSDAGSFVLFDTTGLRTYQATDLSIAVSSDGTSVTVTPNERFVAGHTYAALLYGYDDPAAVSGAGKSGPVVAAPTFFLLRSVQPLLGLCGTGQEPGCVCPATVATSGNVADPTCHSVVTGVSDAQARQLEPKRLQIQAALSVLVPLSGANRQESNLALFWSFTIAKQPVAVYDAVRGDVPMPNDVLINQTTHKVSVTLPSTSPLAGLAPGLDTLDGFSTTGALTVDVDGQNPIDPATLIPNRTVFVINATNPTAFPAFTAAPVYVNGGKSYANQIAITPSEPLASDQNQYVVVLTDGVKDTAGLPLTAAPTMELIKDTNPLYANGHSTVSLLSDAQAQQLETLRLAFVQQKLFATLAQSFGVTANHIASVYTFTTESITRPLLALQGYPTAASLVTDVANVHSYPLSALPAPSALPFCATNPGCPNVGAVITGTFRSRNVEDPTTGTIAFGRTPGSGLSDDTFYVVTPGGNADTDLPFVMTVPKTGSNWPVAIVQHGLTSWRGDMLTLADRFAQAGWATIGFDLAYHGARSACTADGDCVAPGTCSVMTGQCSTSLALYPTASDPLACGIAAVSGLAEDATTCEPIASGKAFVNLSNFFASRDNLRQYIVDATQLTRVLAVAPSASASSLAAQVGYTAAIPQVAYHGLSLGGISGAVFLAVAPTPTLAVLTDCGGHDFEELADGAFASLINPFLASVGIQRDTVAYDSLVNASRWILDPADPFAVAQNLVQLPLTVGGALNAQKTLIQMEDANDPVIPNAYQEALAGAIFGPAGLDANGHTQAHVGSSTVSTYFTDAGHASEISDPNVAVTKAVQNQIVTFISSGGTSLPPPQ